jgi:tripartite-type tricarboxylate transporter receptor subunit TctC
MLFAALAAFDGAAAAAFPAKPVRFVVPYPPGGNTDPVARAIATRLSDTWNQQVIVDNRGGANTIIGAETVSKATADGHTLLLATQATLSINPSVYAKLPYDAAKDFAPVTGLVYYPQVIAAHPSVPANSARELVLLAKQRPGKITYTSSGTASSGHLSGALLESMAGIRMEHIGYRGTGPALFDLLAGRVQLLFTAMAAVQPHLAGGKLKVLGVCSERKLRGWPDIPTSLDSGLKGYESGVWFGIVTTAGTPGAVVQQLNRDIVRTARAPDVAEKFLAQGYDIITHATPSEFAAFIREDREKIGRVARTSRIRPE